MSTMFVVRYATKPEAADDNQAAVEKVFAEATLVGSYGVMSA